MAPSGKVILGGLAATALIVALGTVPTALDGDADDPGPGEAMTFRVVGCNPLHLEVADGGPATASTMWLVDGKHGNATPVDGSWPVTRGEIVNVTPPDAWKVETRDPIGYKSTHC